MRLPQLAFVGIAIATLGGCTCAETVQQTRFACQVTADCLPDNVCRGGECRSEVIPEGACFPGEKQSCAIASCERPCAEDGGWAGCAPATGPGFESNPLNCGECGRRCSDRLGDSLTCIDGRCTCTNDFDCPSGDVCQPGGVCVMNTDACARVTCASGSVCRAGACAPVSCSEGCVRGEVCDVSTSACRPILPCRFAEPCGDGGVCEGRPQPDGEPCNDGIACSFGDSCTAGACNGTAYSCPAPAQCQQAVACAGDGGCAITPVTDGTPCDDGVTCTFDDQCVSGSCGGSAYTCMPSQCAATSVCAGDGGCEVTPRNVGAGCDDGVGCTFSDACGDAGVCEGTVYACPGVTQCKEAGLCLGDGGCDVVNKANSTPCDDNVACTSADSCTNGVCTGTPLTSFQDSDGDGRGNLTVTEMVCPISAGYVLDGGDCNDLSPFVQEVLPVAPDVDQDGVTATTTLDAAACVGAPSTINGRTYYRSSTGASTWLAAASPMADCNDADADVFEARTMMAIDVDHDGYTNGATIAPCVGASSVINGRTYYANTAGTFVYLDTSAAVGTGDCLDSDADVFTSRAVGRDADRDGFTTSTTTTTQCVGAASVINTRTYYEDATGTAVYLGSASATADCNDLSATVTGPSTFYADTDGDTYGSGSALVRCAALMGEVTNNFDCAPTNGNLFLSRSNVVPDDDRDGYPSSVTATTECAGATTTLSARTYYADGTGGHWMGRSDCIESQGANCNPGFIDCYDLNANARITQTAYFNTHRGDGSFDFNCSGAATSVLTGTYCASITAGVAVFSDGACLAPNGTATICNGPAGFSLPAACGKNTAGAATFSNPGVCTAETAATTTVIGCR